MRNMDIIVKKKITCFNQSGLFLFKITKTLYTSSTTSFITLKKLHVSTLEAGYHQAHVQIKFSNAVFDGI